MRLPPKNATIAGRKLRVIFKEFEDGTWGAYSADGREIHLNEKLKDDPQEAWATFLHELTHASLGLGGVSELLSDELEEAIVRNIEQLFLPAILKMRIPRELTLGE